MSDRPLSLAEIGKDHALVHFFALLASMEEIGVVMRFLASGIASMLPMEAVVVGFGNPGADSYKVQIWHHGAESAVEFPAADSDAMQSRVGRTIEEFGYPLHKAMPLVHLGQTIGCIAVGRGEPVELTPEEEFRLTSLQTLSSLLLAKHGVDEALRESEQRVRQKLESILSPESDVGELEMADVIDTPALQALMDEFYEITHMPIGVIDLKGKVLVGVGWQDICTKFHRVNPESCKHCIESDVELSAGVAPGEFKLYHCKNNMWDVATPITVGGKHVGNLFSGQFFFEGEALEYELFRAQAEKYRFDESAYLAALERVRRLKRETVTTGMTFLAKLAEIISKLSYSNVRLARSLAERERAEQALIRSEKLASVGRLAATIAHEVNNPLEAATNALFLVANDVSLSARGREMAEIAERELRRAAQIARRTLGFYREPNERTAVVVPEMFKELALIYDSQMKYKSVRLDIRYPEESAAVRANPGEMRQLFSNLLANSIDAVGEAGTVHLRVGRRSLVNGAPTVRITVADTGKGIEGENLKRIFEPFFTTKKDVGTGLGLWITEQIVKKHGGTIRVRSRVGRGTVFSVRLPAATAMAAGAGQ